MPLACKIDSVYSQRPMKRAKGENNARTRTQRAVLRLDDLSTFARELVCSQLGMSQTKALERGLQLQAEQLPLGLPPGVTWADLWDASEGVRTLRLFALPGYKRTPDEERLRTFVFTHREFFYAERRGALVPHREYVVALWPHLPRYRATWEAQMHDDYWAAANEMRADIKKAGLTPPAARKE
jgi:hypothetical protein